MKVKIKVRPTGGLNGEEWPKVGSVVDLPDHVVEGMVASGHVERVRASEKVEKVETRPAPDEAVETRSPRRKRR